MDLTPSDEQVMLRDSAARFVHEHGAGSARDTGALWAHFAELGWLALPLPERHGGLGGSILDTTFLLEEFGRGPLITPYVSSVILCAGLIAALGDEEQQAAVLPALATGHRRLAFAHVEPGARGGPTKLQSRSTAQGKTWHLSGTKIAVLDALSADTFIVSALQEDRTVLFIVPRDSVGLSCAGYPALGGGEGATVHLDSVILSSEARLGNADASVAIEAATDDAITALCAEMVGVMAALLEATAIYTNTREQFGKPLSANQSVRFKLADMSVALEEARSMALRAALTLDAAADRRIMAVAGAKAGIGRRARLVAELAIQLHGAMGVTDELAIGSYYKRALAFDAMFGGIDHQLTRHARASGRLVIPRATV